MAHDEDKKHDEERVDEQAADPFLTRNQWVARALAAAARHNKPDDEEEPAD